LEARKNSELMPKFLHRIIGANDRKQREMSSMPILFAVQASTLISISVCMIKKDRINALDPARNLAGFNYRKMRLFQKYDSPERRHILVESPNPNCGQHP